jgi:hypothetical protein
VEDVLDVLAIASLQAVGARADGPAAAEPV